MVEKLKLKSMWHTPEKCRKYVLSLVWNLRRTLWFTSWVTDIPRWLIYYKPLGLQRQIWNPSHFQRLSPLFSPSHSWQPTHQNYHYVLVSSHCRLEKGNIDSCQGLNVFVLIPPPSLLCQRQTSTNTEHLNDSNSSHQKDSILQEVEVTD